MDEKLLPQRLRLDSGVLIRALEHASEVHRQDPRTKDCRTLWETALRAKREILIAAPTVVEIRAKRGAPPLPVVKQVRVVPFHGSVADDLIHWGGEDALQEVVQASGAHRKLVRFDAMIVACARWHQADCLVSVDERHMPKLSAMAGIDFHTPSYFAPRQPTLPGI